MPAFPIIMSTLSVLIIFLLSILAPIDSIPLNDHIPIANRFHGLSVRQLADLAQDDNSVPKLIDDNPVATSVDRDQRPTVATRNGQQISANFHRSYAGNPGGSVSSVYGRNSQPSTEYSDDRFESSTNYSPNSHSSTTIGQTSSGYSYQVNQQPQSQHKASNFRIDSSNGAQNSFVGHPSSAAQPGVQLVPQQLNGAFFNGGNHGEQHGQQSGSQIASGTATFSNVDISDPCFRRYANCIVVNAQPYERRSSTVLSQCKSHCLASQSGIYSCRSFVFDNINKICDLFAHVGNQSPARLLVFFGRDYFEPTEIKQGCGGVAIIQTSPIETFETEMPPEERPTVEKNASKKPSIVGPTCAEGELTRYLRITGFRLEDNDDVRLTSVTAEECLHACTNNQSPSNEPTPCQSFDYSKRSCTLTVEAGVPLGNGQLTQSFNTDYYEKICVPSNSAVHCPMVFDRFPQMILVGFAETVVDAGTFEECLDDCLNAQILYGFACISGMFYFEEPQLNCILNTEDRNTQHDLFTEENIDIVDYFETGCPSQLSVRRRAGIRRRISRRRYSSNSGQAAIAQGVRQESLPIQELTVFDRATKLKAGRNDDRRGLASWTEWTPCDRNVDGRRIRYRRCGRENMHECPAQTEWCNRRSAPQNVLNVDALNYAHSLNQTVDDSKGGFRCPSDVCCPIFGGCRIGLKRSSVDEQIRWCANPC